MPMNNAWHDLASGFSATPAVLKDEREDPVQSYGPPIEAATEAAHA
jgi:hypothetical protein